jgi:hypothetical protein
MMLILKLPGYKNTQKSASKRPCIITDPIKKKKKNFFFPIKSGACQKNKVRYQENKCQERTQNQLTTQFMKIKKIRKRTYQSQENSR